ncbi:hypothetical protein Gogos_002335, partial [Gossypium gossypioides]|nr:hypothetical protein [Gossypium gossypioides]
MHQLAGNRGDLVDNGTNHDQPNSNNSFLSGIKQRLLSFIFREIWSEETDQTQVSFLHLQSNFYFVFAHVQFLDRHHLLIKFGSVDVGTFMYLESLKDHIPVPMSGYVLCQTRKLPREMKSQSNMCLKLG